MKPFFFGLALLFVCSSASSQYPPNNLEIRREKIKKVTTESYLSCDPQTAVRQEYVNMYDAHGNLTQTDGYNDAGLRLLHDTYEYDAKDHMTASRWEFNTGASGGETTSYKYNRKGRVTAQTSLNLDGTIKGQHKFKLNDDGKIVDDVTADGKHILKYDAHGNLIEDKSSKADGSVITTVVNTYNDRGYAVQTLVYDSNGNLTDAPQELGFLPAKTVYTYGESEHLTKKEEFNSDGSLRSRSIYERDKGGWVTEERDYDSKGECTGLKKSKYEFYP